MLASATERTFKQASQKLNFYLKAPIKMIDEIFDETINTFM